MDSRVDLSSTASGPIVCLRFFTVFLDLRPSVSGTDQYYLLTCGSPTSDLLCIRATDDWVSGQRKARVAIVYLVVCSHHALRSDGPDNWQKKERVLLLLLWHQEEDCLLPDNFTPLRGSNSSSGLLPHPPETNLLLQCGVP